MYISMNWIKDFVDLEGIDIDNLINRFTLSTAEVEGVIKYGYDIKGVVVGEVKSIEKHSKSEKLKIVKVNVGNKIVQSLCGAPNVEVGQLIPFAPIGSIVKGIEVKEAIIAEEKSEGVCLSEKELGISDDHSGLMILNEIAKDVEIGTDIKEIMDIEDVIFEVDNKSLTHRPDLWGHYGIAREIAALTGRELKTLQVEDLEKHNDKPSLNVKIEDGEKCYRYSALAVENVSKKVSNINMRIRLYYCGTRAINLLADITNYIMLELGQPMHAFDKKYVDHVNVKTVDAQKFVTLDGIERELPNDTLMICSSDKPVAIAGIMGGLDTEIKDTTNSLFLESATFNPVTTRKTAIKLGLRTEASARYEKTLDPEMTVLAIARYVHLLKQVDRDIEVVSRVTDEYVKRYDEVEIEISREYINRLIGIKLEIEKMRDILTSLGFSVEINGDILEVKVPSFRATKDVGIKADLVEEIARIYGYDNIEPITTIAPLKIVKQEESQVIDSRIKDVLSQKYGMSEVHSYVWYDKKANKELKIETEDNIKIINSLNADNNVLRHSMIPSLIQVVDKNIRQLGEVRAFEIGKIFDYPNKGQDCIENKSLGIIIAAKNKNEKELLQEAQEIIRNIFIINKNVYPVITNVTNQKYSWINPVNSGIIEYNNEDIGYVSVLNLIIKNQIDKKMNAVIIEINLDDFVKIEKQDVRYEEISKYPLVNIDLSLIVDKNENYSKIEEYINESKIDNMIKYQLVDIFEDEEKLKGQKSVTIKFTIGSHEYTLTNEQINECIDNLINYFESKGVIIRR